MVSVVFSIKKIQHLSLLLICTVQNGNILTIHLKTYLLDKGFFSKD